MNAYAVTAPGGHHSRLSPNDSSLNHFNFLSRRPTHTNSEDVNPKLYLACAYFGLEMVNTVSYITLLEPEK
jgi:hypothetical protein